MFVQVEALKHHAHRHGVDVLLLYCTPDLVSYYEAKGFVLFESRVYCGHQAEMMRCRPMHDSSMRDDGRVA